MVIPNKRALRPQSSLRAPLNRVLGTETNVRIIRALDALGVPVPIAELARYIEMNKSGVWRAIRVLEELGVVDAVGIGTQQGLQLRKHYPLCRYLTALFQAERNRFEKLIQALTDTTRTLKPSPRSMWIYGPVATRRDPLHRSPEANRYYGLREYLRRSDRASGQRPGDPPRKRR